MRLVHTSLLSPRVRAQALQLTSRPPTRPSRLSPRRLYSTPSSPRSPPPSKPPATAADATAASHTPAAPPPTAAPSASSLSARLAAPLTAYRHAAQTRPYTVQLLTSLFIWFTGDVLAQTIERNNHTTATDAPPADPPAWDPRRTLRALAIGAGAAIPAYHWYNLVSRSFTRLPRGAAIGARVALQQAVFAPVFSAYFFFGQAVLAGASPREAADRVALALPTSWANSLRLWPAVMAVNFALVPPELRSLLPGFVAVGWQAYLCVLNQRAARRLAGDRDAEAVGATAAA